MQINSWPRYNTGSLATLLSLFSSFLSFYSFLLTPHLDAHVREKGKGAPKSPEREREKTPVSEWEKTLWPFNRQKSVKSNAHGSHASSSSSAD